MLGPKVMFRKAKMQDVNILVQIEEACFTADRLSKRSFRDFINNKKDDLIVLYSGDSPELLGYGLILYKKGSSLARLYSIAIHPSQTGKGLGAALLKKLEATAADKKAGYLRLEVASKNIPAQNLYKKLGYYQFDIKKEYYESNDDALCFEKKLTKLKRGQIHNVRYYSQTTEFTCGAASLMMAMSSLDPKIKMSQSLEIQLWREANTIFMLSGHGGCGPRGLALAAKKRDFEVEIFISTQDYLFLNSVRDTKKKEIMMVVQKDFEKQIKAKKIPVKTKRVTFDLVSKLVHEGAIPLVLISSYQMTGTKTPHWIVVSGVDEDFIYFHDPYLDEGQSQMENQHIPIRKDEFNKISKYGSQQLQSIVVLR